MRLLLGSSSTIYGRRYLDHLAEGIVELFAPPVWRVLFVPYAAHDRDDYAGKVRARFAEFGIALHSVHDAPGGPLRAVEEADAIFIGGGNTFRLVDELWRQSLIEPIRRRVQSGMPYMGTSAGSNVACPTLRTTNDMPIVQPPTFDALNLVPFQINPHYQDAVADSTHMGETREQRIAEFHEENLAPVIGLREAAWIRVDGGRVSLEGDAGARLFRRGTPALELLTGARIDEVLGLKL